MNKIKYCNIIHPKEGNINKVKDYTEIQINGTIGEDQNPSSKVTIESKYGNIDLVK